MSVAATSGGLFPTYRVNQNVVLVTHRKHAFHGLLAVRHARTSDCARSLAANFAVIDFHKWQRRQRHRRDASSSSCHHQGDPGTRTYLDDKCEHVGGDKQGKNVHLDEGFYTNMSWTMPNHGFRKTALCARPFSARSVLLHSPNLDPIKVSGRRQWLKDTRPNSGR